MQELIVVQIESLLKGLLSRGIVIQLVIASHQSNLFYWSSGFLLTISENSIGCGTSSLRNKNEGKFHSLFSHFSNTTSNRVANRDGNKSRTLSSDFTAEYIPVGYSCGPEYPPEAAYASAERRMVLMLFHAVSWGRYFFPTKMRVAFPCAA